MSYQSYPRPQSSRFPYHRRPNLGNTGSTSSPPPPPPPPLGGLLQTIKVDDLDEPSKQFSNSATIRNVRTVASYSWVDKKGGDSTVLIPGSPPLWTPPKAANRLSPDDGTYFRDTNAARYPKHPTEPGVIACLRLDPGLPKEINVMGCGSSLGNLLRFVRRQDICFRILVEKVGNTVFLIRRENSPTELIPDVRGYGHAFPEANTIWEPSVKGSSSHQRLIRYEFGGLDFVVRFEADGYIRETSSASPVGKPSGAEPEVSVNSLVGALSGVAVSHQSDGAVATSLVIKKGGSLVPLESILELKTRSIKSRFIKDHLDEQLPRLWVRQIPNFVLAYHTFGTFNPADMEVKNVQEEVKRWEDSHSRDLSRLAALIHEIMELVAGSDDSKLELRCGETGSLEVRKQLPDAGDVLSPELVAQWKNLSGCVKDPCHSDESEPGYDDDSDGYRTWQDDDRYSDGESELDFTACSAHDCGYCGKCPY